ncbi:cytochrome c oxidase cbb3-type subunit 3 [Filimonas zeae]|uniref:Cytochrome c domain-containing protein n=1 Tax=Filimonas zeae TaxID=1737353 RepID=A0A917J4T4_9BACT|nr:cbb3-type cytochrome c oxidase N-terminal domain-containing protein [Filimonas zeae]MDR6341076.1 cytochrome c oxidase cbb3-type subunit 3 [Filimonas zeae]GGH77324.1 hypothetical protein GCM10011379_43500 [Filimonas zeae]
MISLSKYKVCLLAAALLISPAAVFAAGPPLENEMNNPMAITLVMIIVGLLIAIGGLAYVVLSAAQVFVQRHKEEQQQAVSAAGKMLMVLVLCLAGGALYAQEDGAAALSVAQGPERIAGLSAMSFYTLISVIGLELIVIMVLLFNLKVLLGRQIVAVAAAAAEEQPEKDPVWKIWWHKMNNFRSAHEEEALQLDHDYDGIRELDNRLPSWWLYGFYITIIAGVIYMWRYHVSHTAPLSIEEYTIAMERADEQKAAFLAKAANNVDENTVKLLNDGASLEAGKKIFTSVCAACHGTDGGGGVGPNLADDYWLHGGDIKSVFKTIKYGWPEKGMKSWKDDYSPVQIAQLASYVKSLQGTHPATPKEPQGDLFKEGGSDSTNTSKALADSAAVTLK